MLLKLENISKSFHENKVLEDISLQINEGELIYIHGINGCGKSTLFKIMCDIIEADKGEIIKPDDTNIGALIENPSFLEKKTLEYNLKFLCQFHKTYDEYKINELCNKFHLNLFSKTKLKAYSVGMRQKAGIIQAIMENQNLILLDEPTRGLDSDGISILEKEILSLIKEKKTVIIAAHDIIDIPFNKRFYLNECKLVQEE